MARGCESGVCAFERAGRGCALWSWCRCRVPLEGTAVRVVKLGCWCREWLRDVYGSAGFGLMEITLMP